MHILYFFVSLLASGLGAICGIGGGVVIRPVLDATGTMSVSGISFLSGCTVLAMAVVSVLRNGKEQGFIECRISTPLAAGAVLGGLAGKGLFEMMKILMSSENRVGAVQAGLLIAVTLGSMLYSIFSFKIRTCSMKGIPVCLTIGFALGMMSTFLGIGGGPINLTVLFFFFSMDVKKAAANSLYIIMFSQLAGMTEAILSGKIPPVGLGLLLLMSLAGVLGGIIGGKINKKISPGIVNVLFNVFMCLIVVISTYNLFRFLVLI